MPKEMKCFGVSENRNSFGLFGVRLLTQEGHFYEAAANDLNVPRRGDVVEVPTLPNGELNFAAKGFEIPERKYPDAPANVIQAAWSIPVPPPIE